MIREELEALLEGIKDLKRQGVSSLVVDPQSLVKLESAIRSTESSATSASEGQMEKRDSSSGSDQDPSPVALKPIRSTQKEPQIQSTGDGPSSPPPPSFELPNTDRQAQWDWLREKVLNCEICKSHVKEGKKVVFGVGNLDADLFFCGEAPGQEEEIQGEPFVGPAGQLLTKIIQAMGLSRDDVYIGNIMNWRPETDTPHGNRPPTQQEMNFCLPYLKAQLSIVRPKVVIALGATAVNGLLGYDAKRSITKNRGTWHEFEGIPTLITFHPSYVLRNGTIKVKRQIWEDMLSVMLHLGMEISEKQRGYFSKGTG